MESFIRDVRYGIRNLLRQPGFTAVAVVSLALGIGLNTTIFSVVNAVLFREAAIDEPERLVEIYTSPSAEVPHLSTSYPDYMDIREQADVFAGVAVHAMVQAIYSGPDRPELVNGEVVSANYFDVLGVSPALGRGFLPEDDAVPGAGTVAVVSYPFWQTRLSGEAAALGRTIRLSGIEYTVVGVAPPEFSGTIPGLQPELWLPVTMIESLTFQGIQASVSKDPGETRLTRRGTHWLFVKGRLRDGVSIEEARAQFDTILARLRTQYPDTNEELNGAILPRAGVRFHPLVDGYLTFVGAVLLVAVGFVLFIACVNVANLLLARASGRTREIAVRLSIGATRKRLVSQLMTESLLLATIGGALGVGITYVAGGVLSSIRPSAEIPIQFSFVPDATVLVYAILISVATAVFFGLAPALGASRGNVVPALKGEERTGGGGRRGRFGLSGALVVGQLGVSVVLLVGGTLLTRSWVESERIDVGFDPSRIAALSFDLSMNNYSLEEGQALQRVVLERLAAVPGVEAVSQASRLPLSAEINMDGVWIPGHHGPAEDAVPTDVAQVGANYFRVMGIPIIEGRPFLDSDVEGGARVAIINETMARTYWGEGSAVGELIYPDGPDGTPATIVGVSRDHKVKTLGEGPTPYVHFARSQSPTLFTNLLIRTAAPPEILLPTLESEVQSVDPEIVFTASATATEIVGITLIPLRIGAVVLGSFGFLALLLAAVGLYGVIAHSVSRRTREVGLRMAMGASTQDVTRLVLGQGMRLAAVGLGIGGVLAALVTRLLSSLLYGIGSLDPIAFGGAAVILLVVAAVANLVPALRAARVHPITALRQE